MRPTRTPMVLWRRTTEAIKRMIQGPQEPIDVTIDVPACRSLGEGRHRPASGEMMHVSRYFTFVFVLAMVVISASAWANPEPGRRAGPKLDRTAQAPVVTADIAGLESTAADIERQ